MDHDRPQNMKMDGDKDGGGKKPMEERKQKEAEERKQKEEEERKEKEVEERKQKEAEERKQKEEEERKQKEEITKISSRLKNRIKEQEGFTLKHTDEELKSIVQEGRSLKLSDAEIDDLLYISCREAKPISSSELIQQMDNWVNVVQKRGYPHKFASLEEFQQFSGELKKGLKGLGIDSGDVRVQGSSLRTPGAGDVDLAVVISDIDLDQILVNRFSNRITKDGVKIDLLKKSREELIEIANNCALNSKLYN